LAREEVVEEEDDELDEVDGEADDRHDELVEHDQQRVEQLVQRRRAEKVADDVARNRADDAVEPRQEAQQEIKEALRQLDAHRLEQVPEAAAERPLARAAVDREVDLRQHGRQDLERRQHEEAARAARLLEAADRVWTRGERSFHYGIAVDS